MSTDRPFEGRPAVLGALVAEHANDHPPTVDELTAYITSLATEHPGLCTLSVVGKSRENRLLEMLTVQGGDCRVLVVAGPHANEPVGMETVAALASALCRHENLRAMATWHLLLCLDPDGTERNEGWFVGYPPTLDELHRNFFRPPRWEQPEQTVPRPGTEPALPETAALLDVLAEVKPDVYVSLHHCDTKGTYISTSHPDPLFAELLRDFADRRALPVDTAPSDCVGGEPVHTGVFALPRAGHYPVPDEQGGMRLHGTSAAHLAAARYGAVAVLPEAPMLRTRRPRLPAEDSAGLLDDAADVLEHVLKQLTGFAGGAR